MARLPTFMVLITVLVAPSITDTVSESRLDIYMSR